MCIQALNRIKSNKLKRAIIANADADMLCALAECAYNILKQRDIPLTALQRRRLSKYRTKLRELGQRRTPAARRRRLTNMLCFLEEIAKWIVVGSPVDIIYLDFQKAFDKVPHQRLLLKLKAHGIGDSITDWRTMAD